MPATMPRITAIKRQIAFRSNTFSFLENSMPDKLLCDLIRDMHKLSEDPIIGSASVRFALHHFIDRIETIRDSLGEKIGERVDVSA